MKKYSYEFQITGTSSSEGKFSENGGGSMRLDDSKSMSGSVQAELVQEAMDFFLKVIQPKKKYEKITEISVVVTNIECIG